MAKKSARSRTLQGRYCMIDVTMKKAEPYVSQGSAFTAATYCACLSSVRIRSNNYAGGAGAFPSRAASAHQALMRETGGGSSVSVSHAWPRWQCANRSSSAWPDSVNSAMSMAVRSGAEMVTWGTHSTNPLACSFRKMFCFLCQGTWRRRTCFNTSCTCPFNRVILVTLLSIVLLELR